MATTTESSSSSVRTASVSDKVRIVRADEYQPVAYTLAEAFLNDEVGRYFIDAHDMEHWTEEQKWDLHLSILEYMVYAHVLKGVVTTIGDDYGCVALWMPPNTHMDDTMTLFRSGLWRLYYKLTAEGRHRFFNEFFPLLHHTKSSVLGPRDEDSYYLVYIGTRESARGKGLARELISDMTAKADVEGRAMYLESSNAANLGFYRRLGFEVRKVIALKRGEKDVVLDVMVREPAAPDGKEPDGDTSYGELEKAETTGVHQRVRVEIGPQTTGNGEKNQSIGVKDMRAHTVDSKPLLV